MLVQFISSMFPQWMLSFLCISFNSSALQFYYCQMVWPMPELVQVTESDAVDALELALKRYSVDVTTRAMCLVALLKLSSRFPPTSE